MGVIEAAAVTAVLLLCCGCGVRAQSSVAPSSLPYTSPTSCSEAGEIFLSGNLSCVPCEADHSASSADGMSVADQLHYAWTS